MDRQIHEEATEILYGRNRFDYCQIWRNRAHFEGAGLALFLERIGSINALHIRCIRIDFPVVSMHSKKSGDVLGLDSEVDTMFDTLQKHCSNLRSVTMSRVSAESQARCLNNHQRPGFLVESFDIIESRIRAVSACRADQEEVQDNEIGIAMEVNAATVEEDVSTETRREMVSRGWVLDKVDLVDEDRDELVLIGDVDWSHLEVYRQDSDDGASDNVIDNDSDFWRRADDYVKDITGLVSIGRHSPHWYDSMKVRRTFRRLDCG